MTFLLADSDFDKCSFHVEGFKFNMLKTIGNLSWNKAKKKHVRNLHWRHISLKWALYLKNRLRQLLQTILLNSSNCITISLLQFIHLCMKAISILLPLVASSPYIRICTCFVYLYEMCGMCVASFFLSSPACS